MLRHRTRPRRRQAGFSLIEVLVALAIAAGVLTAFYQAAAASMALRKRGLDEAGFALLGETLVSRLGGEIALEPGQLDGKEKGLAWSIRIAAARDVTVSDDRSRSLLLPAGNLLRISIALFRPGTSQPDYVIETLRLDPRLTP